MTQGLPLGAYLVEHGLATHDGSLFSFQGEQGTAIGRSGRVGVTVDIRDGEPVRVRISGRAVIVFKTKLCLS
ncbi:PhzF family phenazine biosynthesis protein [Paenibacillus tepidiphilus]|uniref:PhzF family phenazine biosynthesis protein n=1 Tax=Paenibacillus tepidiphilus TaxID=2608683 RepID=UPI00123B3B64|nr:PhzF family phenazine biosynthesis protein [Paenibacillus tepidiphilus]